ncbi:MAG: acyl-CoA mutase large subunit family protein, partial [Thermodesulfobacteriota bacterium]|nr:acyl-CoA mutase large subunit family protein [Thermodesulfobacteriota bacterium]
DWFENVAKFPPEPSFKLMGELIRYTSSYMPLWNNITFVGYNMHEAGANAFQELAFSLAAANAVTQQCLKAGLDPDDVLPRYGWYMSSSDDFFENVAKLRALRKMWFKIARERFGCKNPKSLQARIHVQTAGSSLTAQQPLNNISRIVLQTLSAVFAGANSIWPVGYDEAIALPTEDAVTLSLRAQQIIMHESHVPHVSDPLGGSYYLESLTKEIEERAWKLFEEVDSTEEYIRRCKNGWFKKIVEENAYEWRRKIDSGEKIKVGINKYVADEEQDVPVFKIDPEIERTAIERVKQFRSTRDDSRVHASLKKLRESAEKMKSKWPQEGYLMDDIIEAVKADATLGEMCEVLKQVFGWGYTY